MARVRQEVEEIRLQMTEEKRPEAEVAEWETLIQAVSNENNSATILTSRLQKLSSSSTSRAAITVLSPKLHVLSLRILIPCSTRHLKRLSYPDYQRVYPPLNPSSASP